LIKDYQTGKAMNMLTGEQSEIDLPKSNVLQFFLEDGSKISVRPSGTEPKIKFYFGVKDDLSSKEKFRQMDAKLNEKLEGIIKSMRLR